MYKDLRNKLGLSQAQLAGYLGISRSQVAMIETGRREMDSKNYLDLVDFYTRFSTEDDSTANDIPVGTANSGNEAWLKKIDTIISDREYLLTKAGRTLKKMQQKHKRSTDILSRLELMKNQGQLTNDLLARLVELNAQESGESAAAEKLLKLQMRIAGLTAELAFLKERRNILKSDDPAF